MRRSKGHVMYKTPRDALVKHRVTCQSNATCFIDQTPRDASSKYHAMRQSNTMRSVMLTGLCGAYPMFPKLHGFSEPLSGLIQQTTH